MGNYLVTGVAGFIGSAVAAALVRKGDAVTGIDSLVTGNAADVPDSVHFIRCDCLEETLYTKVLSGKKYDAILHMAGQSSPELSFADPGRDLQANARATLRLAQYALASGCTRFIYASSMSVYGFQGHDPVSEEAHPAPDTFCGVSKLAGEQYLRLYEQQGLRPTCLRLSETYGPGQSREHPQGGMVTAFLGMMLENGHIHVNGNPNRFRDFVYIDDVVTAFLSCLDHPQSCGKVINVGGSGKVTVGELVERLISLSSSPVTVEYSGCTPGDMHGIHADISMAAKYLGYEAEVSLSEGLRRLYAWYGRDKG